jgi:hypothetical protein
MGTSLGLCNGGIKHAFVHQIAAKYLRGVFFFRRADTVGTSLTHFFWRMRETLGAFASIASFKNSTGRHICPILSKLYSPLVFCLWLRPVAALPKKKQYTLKLSQSSKNRQCPNTKTQDRQGVSPAFPSAAVRGAEFKCPRIVSTVFPSDFSILSISPMNLPAASSKLARIQTNRGIPC